MPSSTTIFASAGDDVKIWNGDSMQIIKQYNYHDSNIKDVTWNQDNTVIATTSLLGDAIVLCDPTTAGTEKPKIIQKYAENEQQTSACFGRRGKTIFSGGSGGDLNVWDCKSGKLKKKFEGGHKSPVTCLAINNAETHVVSACTTGEVVAWNTISGKPLCTFHDVKDQAVRGLKYSPWKDYLFGTASDDGSICLWDTNKQELRHKFKDSHGAPAMDLTFSPLNHLLVSSCGLDKKLLLYDVQSKNLVNTIYVDHPLTAMCFLGNGVHICVGSSLGRLYKYDLRKSNAPVSEISAHSTSIKRIVLQTILRKVPKEKDGKNVSSTQHSVSRNHHEENRAGKQPSSTRQKDEKPSSRSETFSSKNNDTQVDSSSGDLRHSKNKDPAKVIHQGKNESINFVHGPDALPETTEKIESTGTNRPTFGSNYSSFRDTLGSYCEDLMSPVSLPKPNKEFKSDPLLQHVTQNEVTSNGTSTKKHKDKNSFVNGYEESDMMKSPAHSTRHNETSMKGAKTTTPSRNKYERKHTYNSETVSHSKTNPYSNQHSPSPRTHSSIFSKVASVSSHSDTDSNHESPAPRISDSGALASKSGATASHSSVRTDDSSTDNITPFQYQMEYIKNTVQGIVENIEDNVRDEVRHLHLQMIKMFSEQEERMSRLAEQCSINPVLLQEIERLRAENDRLRRKY